MPYGESDMVAYERILHKTMTGGSVLYFSSSCSVSVPSVVLSIVENQELTSIVQLFQSASGKSTQKYKV